MIEDIKEFDENKSGEYLSRKLIRYAVIIFILVLFIDLTGRFLEDWYPLDNDSSALIRSAHKISYFLEWANPYLLAALGASMFLLRQAKSFIRGGVFKEKYIREYWIRFWVGIFAGGTAVLVFFEELSSTADGRISLSEAMVGFMFGYASDVFFKWLDVTISLFKPNVKEEDIQPTKKILK